jgi:hypothetical protein
MCSRLNLDPCLTFYKIHSKRMKHCNVSSKTLKLLWKTLENIGIGYNFLNRNLLGHEIRATIENMTHQIKMI